MPFQLTVNDTGPGVSGPATTTPTGLHGVLTPSPANRRLDVLPGSPTYIVSIPVAATVTGGTPPYTYAWSEKDTGSGGGISILQPQVGANATFYVELATPTGGAGNSASGVFKLIITDFVDAELILYLSVRLELELA